MQVDTPVHLRPPPALFHLALSCTGNIAGIPLALSCTGKRFRYRTLGVSGRNPHMITALLTALALALVLAEHLARQRGYTA